MAGSTAGRFGATIALMLLPMTISGAALAARSSPSVVLQDGTLAIEGTFYSDLIVIQEARGKNRVSVILNGRPSGPFGPVRRIVVHAGEGRDTVRLDPSLSIPAVLHGGPGDDRLIGGAGPDIFYGEDGDDVMVGAGDRDAFLGGSGRDSIVLPRSMGTIATGPSAAGETLALLRKAYTLQPLGRRTPDGPLLVGAKDLADTTIRQRLREVYARGETVAVSGATLADAALLASSIGHEAGASWTSDEPRMDLVLLRRAIRPDGRSHLVTEVIAPSKSGRGRTGGRVKRQAEEHRLELLSRSLSRTAVVPDPPPGDDPANLLQLADSSESKTMGVDSSTGNTIQVITEVWAARSFQNSFDAYYLQQELDISLGDFANVQTWSNVVGTFGPGDTYGTAPTVVAPSPESSMTTTSVTSGMSESFGGNVGFNQSQLANVTGSGGVTISNSKTTEVPPITIENEVDDETGVTGWTYIVNDRPSFAETVDVYQQWIWQIPFGSYPKGTTKLFYAPGGSMLVEYRSNPAYELDTPQINPGVPLPFGTSFTIDDPLVTSLSSSLVEEGSQFVIYGTGFYPALVQAVLIGGTPLQASQYVVTNAQTITAIAPFIGALMPVTVQTTEGFSNDTYTITVY